MFEDLRRISNAPDANSLFGSLSMEFERLEPGSLGSELLRRYDCKARELLLLARLSGGGSNLDLACARFKGVHGELIRRELRGEG